MKFSAAGQSRTKCLSKKAKPKKVALSPRAEALVTWLDPDRALVTLSPSKLSAQRLALTTLVREWVTQL